MDKLLEPTPPVFIRNPDVQPTQIDAQIEAHFNYIKTCTHWFPETPQYVDDLQNLIQYVDLLDYLLNELQILLLDRQ